MSARRGAVLGRRLASAGLGLASLVLAMTLAPILVGEAMAAGCNCTPPPPPSCNCTVPSNHEVNIPGVNVTPPSVTVNAPSINVETGSIVISGAGASSSSSATASASASSTANSTGLTNAQATALATGALNAAGGGSSWYTSDSPTGYIPNLVVEGVENGEAKRICTEMRAVETMVAVQAVCLDDKEIPHPASQVMPERDVAANYEGEIYRCIAGARMQYTLAEFHGQANFDHGQTITCQKGEALYHSAAGALACHAQRPARDCNERSLLRRFGAGIKVLKLSAAKQCVAYRTETAKAASETMVLDGGVGGIVH
jgi:hypothetical protein